MQRAWDDAGTSGGPDILGVRIARAWRGFGQSGSGLLCQSLGICLFSEVLESARRCSAGRAQPQRLMTTRIAALAGGGAGHWGNDVRRHAARAGEAAVGGGGGAAAAAGARGRRPPTYLLTRPRQPHAPVSVPWPPCAEPRAPAPPLTTQERKDEERRRVQREVVSELEVSGSCDVNLATSAQRAEARSWSPRRAGGDAGGAGPRSAAQGEAGHGGGAAEGEAEAGVHPAAGALPFFALARAEMVPPVGSSVFASFDCARGLLCPSRSSRRSFSNSNSNSRGRGEALQLRRRENSSNRSKRRWQQQEALLLGAAAPEQLLPPEVLVHHPPDLLKRTRSEAAQDH